ncbi:methyltransferase domain-containing protein [Lysobacter soyae]|uniref:Methyltransferase domain-containing protein n=1 Tax=Lysobacter soyae TaxID=2764185 RepID=A0ABX8WLZ6_9GAMM|nr:methyltransferase domain-containing protein [Lysobacter sp. CJ11]QYR52662.1 methyltransferase domain-containing protein [Lysobacter sp. CJ11]
MISTDDREFTGKYEQASALSQILIDRFHARVLQLLDLPTAGDLVLEVGCGAGYSTHYLRTALQADQSLFACDIGNTLLASARRRNPCVEYFQSSVYSMPIPDKSVDSVVMLEVLEHLENPRKALEELQRITRQRVVISTPREPIWRVLNVARGKYLKTLGNTPGHIQHWSSASLAHEAGRYFHVEAISRPTPWTILKLLPRR